MTQIDITAASAKDSDPRTYRITVWLQTRPSGWFGLAVLPEFWLAVLLAAGFIASVIADRRIIRIDKCQMTNAQ